MFLNEFALFRLVDIWLNGFKYISYYINESIQWMVSILFIYKMMSIKLHENYDIWTYMDWRFNKQALNIKIKESKTFYYWRILGQGNMK